MTLPITYLKKRMTDAQVAFLNAEELLEDNKDPQLESWYSTLVFRASSIFQEAREEHLNALLEESEL